MINRNVIESVGRAVGEMTLAGAALAGADKVNRSFSHLVSASPIRRAVVQAALPTVGLFGTAIADPKTAIGAVVNRGVAVGSAVALTALAARTTETLVFGD